jgi:transcriptional regulator with XRE-family HTH domain
MFEMNEVNEVIQGVVGQQEARNMANAAVMDSKSEVNAAWSGELSAIELKKPGGLLLAALIQCANSRGLSILDLAAKLGVTYGYINQLRNGLRGVGQVSDEFTQSCANFLQVPRLTVLMLAGKVTSADLLSSGSIAERELASALQFLSANSEFGHLVTEELREASFDSKYLLVKLFERATGKRLLGTEVDVEALAREMKNLGVLTT